MSSLAALSPTSLQLRFRRGSRRPPSPFRSVHFQPFRRQISMCVSAGTASGGGGTPDLFAGWADEGFDAGEPKSKGFFSGGIVGMGLAGVLCAAGVTFTTLSLTNRATSRTLPQMKPLTVEQEVQISSDDAVVEDENVDGSTISMLQTESNNIGNNSNIEKGKKIHLIPFSENKEDACERSDNIQESETQQLENFSSVGMNFDIIKETPVHDVIEGAQDFIIDPVPSEFIRKQPELQGDATVSSSGISSLKDLDVATFSDRTASIATNDAIIGNIDTDVHSTSADTDPRDQDNLSRIIINSKSQTPLQIPRILDGQLSYHSLDSSVRKIEQSGTIDSQSSLVDARVTDVSTSLVEVNEKNLQPHLEPSTNHPVAHGMMSTDTEMIVELDTSISKDRMLQFQSMSAQEGQNINGIGAYVAYSASESTNTSKKEPDVKSSSESDTSSLFESILPKKTFSHSGIPAPSLVSAAMQVPPKKVLIPPAVDQVQGQALAALQVLKVIEADVLPGDLCTRREYARWLVSASSVLSRNTTSKVYPAMYIENITELAFDDVAPNDPDFPYIQGLAEAGLLSSKLSTSGSSESDQHDNMLFFPDSPVSRQDLVSWKMALERRELPEVDKNYFYRCTGYLDIDKINPDAWPALLADLSSGEQGITALAFGFTRLFQPDKPVTKAQAAIALATGEAAEVVSEELARIEAESLAETAVNTHNALVAEVEKDLNLNFREELAKEREKIETLEKLAEETRLELERLRKQREEEKNDLIRGQATVESEMEVLSRLRHEMEEQLQSVMSSKMEISFERERISKLREEVESENQVIAKLQNELEVERKALSMARTWAEEEAKRVREQARALEEARQRWEKHGMKVVVDGDLQSDASFEPTWVTAGEQSQAVEAIDRGEKLVKKLKNMVAEIKLRSSAVIQSIIKKIDAYISSLKQQILERSRHVTEHNDALLSKAKNIVDGLQEGASNFSSNFRNQAKKVVGDCKEGIEKITQQFKK